jgi:hypothetical protein
VWSEGGPTTVVEFRRERVSRFADRRARAHLNGQMRDFIARQEMVFVSAGGDCSMRSGAPGFVSVLGRRHVSWPCFDVVGPVSLLFVSFFDEVGSLHISGRALADGRLVVEEAYFGGVGGRFGGVGGRFGGVGGVGGRFGGR